MGLNYSTAMSDDVKSIAAWANELGSTDSGEVIFHVGPWDGNKTYGTVIFAWRDDRMHVLNYDTSHISRQQMIIEQPAARNFVNNYKDVGEPLVSHLTENVSRRTRVKTLYEALQESCISSVLKMEEGDDGFMYCRYVLNAMNFEEFVFALQLLQLENPANAMDTHQCHYFLRLIDRFVSCLPYSEHEFETEEIGDLYNDLLNLREVLIQTCPPLSSLSRAADPIPSEGA